MSVSKGFKFGSFSALIALFQRYGRVKQWEENTALFSQVREWISALNQRHFDIEKSYVPSGIIRSLSYIRYSPAGRSVLGETVPKVLTTARGQAVLRLREQFLPIQT